MIKRVVLGSQHQPTGKTIHRRGTDPVPTPQLLQIVQYADDAGYYLLYCDARGNELTDTYHDTLEAAMSQAEFEFRVRPFDWEDAPTAAH